MTKDLFILTLFLICRPINCEAIDLSAYSPDSRPMVNSTTSGRAAKPGMARHPIQTLPKNQRVERRTVFFGRLLGHDGWPIPRAHVHLSRFNDSKPLVSVEAGKNGSFELVTAESGLLILWFTGIDHQSRKMTLLVDKPQKLGLDVKLKSYDYMKDFDGVKIIGDFNNFSFKSAQAMDRQKDGTFVAEFETTTSRFAYQLVGLTKGGGSINGTQSEDYVYDGGGDYRSVVTPMHGHIKIVFDPKKLARSEASGTVAFRNANSIMARFVSIYEAMMQRRERLHDALVEYKKTGRPLNQFSYNWSPDLAHLSQKILKEKTYQLRQALLFSYLDLGYGTYGARLNGAITRKALSEIAPTSQLWSIEPTLIGVAIDSTGRPESYTAYIQQVTHDHPDPAVVKTVKAGLSPDRQIMVGKIVPSFSLASLDQPGNTYTSESLKGKLVMIDFWATWCVPCIEEMSNLHQEYEKFKGQGFEILSVSLDEKPEVVKEFRKEKWKMPWLNALLSTNPEVKKQFDIVGIPKAILMDRSGRIVATDRDLRGRHLEQTLKHVLSAPK
jgi:thiol-disulfide isomerase/thioredoxin